MNVTFNAEDYKRLIALHNIKCVAKCISLYIYVYQNIDVLKTECELILKQLLSHNLVNDSRVSVFTALKDYMYVQNETLS